MEKRKHPARQFYLKKIEKIKKVSIAILTWYL